MGDDERALIDRILRGEGAAFASLVDRYHGKMLRLALLFVKDPAAAEEVAQDAWIGVLEGLATFEGRSSLKTWIFRILANRARTRATRDARSVPFSALAGAEGDDPAVEPERFDQAGHWSDGPGRWDEESPEKLALRRETMAVLETAMAGLPAGQRAVLTLRDVEGMEADDICNVLGITVTNQRVLLHRARSRVRRALDRHMRGK